MAAGSSSIWDRLTAEEFKQLQEYTKYSKRSLKDVLLEFRRGLHEDVDPEKPMGYSGFKLFMSSYLGENISDELCQTLFWTFHKRVPLSDAAARMASPKLPGALVNKFLQEYRNSQENLENGSDMSRIAKGTRKVTLVATATVVAGTPVDDTFHEDDGVTTDGQRAPSSATNKSSSSCSSSQTSVSKHKRVSDASNNVDKDLENRLSPDKNSLKSKDGKLDAKCNLQRPTSEIGFQSTYQPPPEKSLSFDEISSQDLSQTKTCIVSQLQFVPMIEIKEIACYLSLLEGGDVKDKLEFVFRVYDSDDNDYLDQEELESIVQQMIRVAEYLGWDTAALKPILNDMLAEMDYDSDGQISMEEWIKGGMNNIPFLVLLGMDVKMDDDGKHQWQMRHFKSQAFCNICHSGLEGQTFGKRQGFQCIFCKYTVHERCVNRVPNSCLQTYSTSKSKKMQMDHHWVEGNCTGKCRKCGKAIKTNCLTGLRCAWCHVQIHNRCRQNINHECNLGEHRVHILPHICITPNSVKKDPNSKKNSVISPEGIPMLIQALPNTFPLAVFVNPKSGGRQGAQLLNKFRYLLNPRQVFNLADDGPMPGLKFFSQESSFRVLCCGGDGTAGWVLSAMDKLPTLKNRPPMSIIPLGTGNDLSRCLRWGGGYEGGSVEKYLYKTANSTTVMLDRWSISLKALTDEPCDSMPLEIMNNYFSIGVDASIALKFHLQREKNPERFNSRFKNKLRYFEAGTSEQLAASCKKLQDDVELICDGKKIDLASSTTLEGIAILNISSIYGGANIWGESEKKNNKLSSKTPKAPDDPKHLKDVSVELGDKKIEVVGLESSLYVGQIISGFRQHGIRLAQCSHLVIRVNRKLPMQIDGEPWMQSPCEATISHKNQTPMCQAPHSQKRRFMNFFRRSGGSCRDEDEDEDEDDS